MSKDVPGYRQLSTWETRLILRLLEPAFSGQEVLRAQVGEALGRPIDENGSLDLQSGLDTKALVMKRVPSEGSATDRDGTTIHYLLHVVDGAIQELEVYKDDSSKVLEHPEPEAVEVMILG